MAGMGARDIRRKIKSINSTKQITKAMELVSTAKLKRNRRRFEATKPYFTKVLQTIHDIFDSENNIKHPLVSTREVKSSLFIVLTADRGLCGGYNVNVLKAASAEMAKVKNPKIIAIGRKAREFFSSRGYEIVETFEHISEKPSNEDAKKISELALKLYLDEEVDEIHLVSTKMLSTISQLARSSKVLPLVIEEDSKSEEEAEVESEGEDNGDIVTYAPSPEVVLDILMPKLVNSAVLSALIESSAAEQAARRNAMESASENAQEMIENLSLSYNQARQAAITQEITEIVGGANALE